VHRNTLRQYLSGGKPVFADAFSRIAAALAVTPLDLLTDSNVGQSGTFEVLRQSIGVLARRHPSVAFLLIGSRAKGRAKKYSDWDIGVTRGPTLLSTEEYLQLKIALLDRVENETEKVDVINLDQAPLSFLKGISYDPVPLGGNGEAWAYFKGKLNGLKEAA
jgi:predicted nucleotidyltransferase